MACIHKTILTVVTTNQDIYSVRLDLNQFEKFCEYTGQGVYGN